jgi:hypothetical protein
MVRLREVIGESPTDCWIYTIRLRPAPIVMHTYWSDINFKACTVLFLGRVAAEDLLHNFVDLLVVFFRAGVRIDISARHAAPDHW